MEEPYQFSSSNLVNIKIEERDLKPIDATEDLLDPSALSLIETS